MSDVFEQILGVVAEVIKQLPEVSAVIKDVVAEVIKKLFDSSFD